MASECAPVTDNFQQPSEGHTKQGIIMNNKIHHQLGTQVIARLIWRHLVRRCLAFQVVRSAVVTVHLVVVRVVVDFRVAVVVAVVVAAGSQHL